MLAMAADIDGTWKGPELAGGRPVLKLKANGDKVTGTMLGADGIEKRINEGKVRGNDISFSLDFDWEGTPTKILVKGTISGNEMRLRMDEENGYWGTDVVV